MADTVVEMVADTVVEMVADGGGVIPRWARD